MKTRKLELKEIKNIEVDILSHLDAFCKENGIKYFLSNGTLLGAVRHKGFIPWDDDIDIVMMREDYDKFISLYKDSRYVLFEDTKQKNYLYPFAKLSDSKTIIDERFTTKESALGVYVDIFPLDYCNENFEKAKKDALNSHRISMALIFSKKKLSCYKELEIKTRILFTIVGLLTKLIPRRLCIKLIKDYGKKYNSGKYVASMMWAAYKGKEVMPSEIFDEAVQGEFEGRSFPIPKDYEKYLEHMYKKWWELPPEEKRKTHHDFDAYLIQD